MANYTAFENKSQGFKKYYYEALKNKELKNGDLMTKDNVKVKTYLFSLPPIVSCLNCNSCKSDCFALKSYHQYPSTMALWDYNFNLVKNDLFKLYDKLDNQLKRIARSKGAKMVRIHQSGDFYSQNYLNMWCDLIAKYPMITFFGYTKVNEILDFSRMDQLTNCNIVRSMVGKKRNFGSLSYVTKLANETNGVVCGAYGEQRENVKCGETCFKCMEHGHKNVFFVQH